MCKQVSGAREGLKVRRTNSLFCRASHATEDSFDEARFRRTGRHLPARPHGVRRWRSGDLRFDPEPSAASSSTPITSTAPPTTAATTTAAADAVTIAEQIRTAVPEVSQVVEITEDNDPNDTIGRPGSYVTAPPSTTPGSSAQSQSRSRSIVEPRSRCSKPQRQLRPARLHRRVDRVHGRRGHRVRLRVRHRGAASGWSHQALRGCRLRGSVRPDCSLTLYSSQAVRRARLGRVCAAPASGERTRVRWQWRLDIVCGRTRER